MSDEADEPPTSGPQRKSPLPALADLHQRHVGLTPMVCGSYAEAASVCLARHHTPPTDFEVVHHGAAGVRELQWSTPDERTQRAHNNETDATEQGAYSLACASVEAELGFITHERSEVRTGADYYVGPPGQNDLESAYRLEVSGVSAGNRGTVATRVRRKLEQVAEGRSDRPAMVCVIGFLTKLIVIESLEEESA